MVATKVAEERMLLAHERTMESIESRDPERAGRIRQLGSPTARDWKHLAAIQQEQIAALAEMVDQQENSTHARRRAAEDRIVAWARGHQDDYALASTMVEDLEAAARENDYGRFDAVLAEILEPVDEEKALSREGS